MGREERQLEFSPSETPRFDVQIFNALNSLDLKSLEEPRYLLGEFVKQPLACLTLGKPAIHSEYKLFSSHVISLGAEVVAPGPYHLLLTCHFHQKV